MAENRVVSRNNHGDFNASTPTPESGKIKHFTTSRLTGMDKDIENYPNKESVIFIYI